MKTIILLLIKIYQKTLSPDHGPLKYRHPYGFCRFYPTCSEYTYQAVGHYGVARGLARGFWRVLRCNPFARPAADLPRQ